MAHQITNQLLPVDQELWRRVCEIVHCVWDPIGVCELPEAHDEYSGYLIAIYGFVKAGDSAGMLEYLRWAEETRMGLAFNDEKAGRVVSALLRWRAFVGMRER